MRFTPTTRLIALAVLLLVSTGLLWWGVGFHVGSALLDGSSVWGKSFGYGPLGIMRLFALAIVVPVTIAVVTSVPPQTRWLSLAAVAFGAVLLYGDQSRGDIIGVVVLVLAVAAMTESNGTSQAVGAVAIALVISFAALQDLAVPTAQKTMAVVVRALFFYVPLLLGPTYLERHALKRLAR